jgi:hypothetical protein
VRTYEKNGRITERKELNKKFKDCNKVHLIAERAKETIVNILDVIPLPLLKDKGFGKIKTGQMSKKKATLR